MASLAPSSLAWPLSHGGNSIGWNRTNRNIATWFSEIISAEKGYWGVHSKAGRAKSARWTQCRVLLRKVCGVQCSSLLLLTSPLAASSSSFSSSSFSSPLHRRLSAHNFSCCCAAGALSAAAWPRFESRLVFGLLHDGAAPQAPQNTCLFCLASPKPSLWEFLRRLVEALWVILGEICHL